MLELGGAGMNRWEAVSAGVLWNMNSAIWGSETRREGCSQKNGINGFERVGSGGNMSMRRTGYVYPRLVYQVQIVKLLR